MGIRSNQLLERFQPDEAGDIFVGHGENASQVFHAFFTSGDARSGERECRCVGVVGEGCGVAHAFERVEVEIGGECSEVCE